MVMQAKLERRQRRQAEKSCKTTEESRSMLGSMDDMTAGHPQSIPPPSEPVLPAGGKVLSPKAANGGTSSEMSHQAVYAAGQTVPEHELHAQTQAQFTEDKSEARHSAAVQKGKAVKVTFIVLVMMYSWLQCLNLHFESCQVFMALLTRKSGSVTEFMCRVLSTDT